MKKYFSLFCVVAVLGMLSGCSIFIGNPVVPPYGWTFNDTTAPTDTTFDNTTIGSLQGTAQAQSILGLVAWGDASQYAAARAGNMQNIDHIDCEIFNILGVYTRYTLVAHGH